MIVRPSTKRPPEFAFTFGNWVFVDAGEARFHKPGGGKPPILVAVGPEPLPTVIVILICKTHSDPVPMEGPEFLRKPVVEFPPPFTDQELFDLQAPAWKFSSVSPAAIGCVGKHDDCRVTCVPSIFSCTDFLDGCVFAEGREWRATHHRRASATANVSMYWRNRAILPSLIVQTCA